MLDGSANTMRLLLPSLLLLSAASLSSAFVVSAPRTGAPPSSLLRLNVAANTLEGRIIADGGSVVPLNNFLLVKVADIQDETDSGILLTNTAKIVKTEGTVVSVGPGRTHGDSGLYYEIPVSPGDGVVYGKYDGTVLDYGGSRHALIRDDDILVKFSGDKLTVESADVCNESILILGNERGDQTAGGLLLAAPKKGDAASRPSTGKVIKVGSGKMAADGTRMSMPVEVGDQVKFRDFAGNEVDIDGKEYSVVKMTDILAKF